MIRRVKALHDVIGSGEFCNRACHGADMIEAIAKWIATGARQPPVGWFETIGAAKRAGYANTPVGIATQG